MYYPVILQNLGHEAQVVSQTITGASAEQLLFQGGVTENRTGVLLHNNDATLKVWVMLNNLGNSPPTVDVNNRLFTIQPEQTIHLPVGDHIEIWMVNSSGGVTASTITAFEVL